MSADTESLRMKEHQIRGCMYGMTDIHGAEKGESLWKEKRKREYWFPEFV